MEISFQYYANGITKEPNGYMRLDLDKVLRAEKSRTATPMTMVQFRGVLKVLKTLAADDVREWKCAGIERWLAERRNSGAIAKNAKLCRRLDGMAKAYEDVFGKKPAPVEYDFLS